jgi:hypothetical protein
MNKLSKIDFKPSPKKKRFLSMLAGSSFSSKDF